MKRRTLLVVVLIAVVILVFGSVRDFAFLTWDDNINVTENPHVLRAGSAGLAVLWSEPYAGLYVPAASTWFWTLAQLSRSGPGAPLDPAWFHVGNLVLHALGAWLLFRVVARIQKNETAAFLGALVCVVHPLVVEPVAWISEARGLLGFVFSLLALDLALSSGGGDVATDPARRPTARATWRIALASLAFAAALLSKPAAVVLPVVLIVIERGARGTPWRRALPVPCAWLVMSLVTVFVTKSAQSDEMLRHVPSVVERPIVALDALGFYLVKLVAPFDLAIDHGRTPRWVTEELTRAWPALVALAVAALVVCVRPGRRFLPPFLVFVLALAPVLGLVPFVYQDVSTVADRYALPALLGVAWAVASGTESLGARFGSRVAYVGVGTIALALALASAAILPAWRDDTALFTRALQVNPRSFKAESNLALAATRAGRYDEAIARYERALEHGGSRWIVHQNLGVALYQAGRKIECEDHLARSFEKRRESVQVATMLGTVRLELGRYRDAIDPLEVAARLDPRNPTTAEWLGAAYLVEGRANEAVRELRRALSLRDVPATRANLAQASIEAGDVRGAIAEYRALVASKNASAEVEANLAWLLATTPDDALRDGAEALAIAERLNASPAGRTARSLDVWGVALACVGRHAEAEARAKEALAALPADPGAAQDALRASYEERRAAYARGEAWRAPAARAPEPETGGTRPRVETTPPAPH